MAADSEPENTNPENPDSGYPTPQESDEPNQDGAAQDASSQSGSEPDPAEQPPEHYDLSSVLGEWPFEPGTINVRVIRGIDQLPKIQVRLDLGIIQMNIDGRPDGLRPHGFSSLLEYYEARADETEAGTFDDETAASDSETDLYETGSYESDAYPADPADAFNPAPSDHDTGDASFSESGNTDEEYIPAPLSLDGDACRALREEAAQFYHRYVALLVLEDFEGVIRDTSRNLRVADLCRAHAQDDRDRAMLEQVRPYIIMMRTRAVAGQALKDDVPKAAIAAVDDGLTALRDHYAETGEPDEFEISSEAQSLREMRDALVPKLPVSQKTELRERLHEAIRKENYELAAILRNELRMLGE